MLIIPLQDVPNQVVSVPLSGQSVQISVYLRGTDLFMDVFVGASVPVIQGVICQNENLIVRNLYLGFQGDFAFFDTEGSDDPVYTGLGTRFQLVYIEPSELPEGIG
jgi:hypothetical protein